MAKITITLDEKILQKAIELCINSGENLDELLSKIISRELESDRLSKPMYLYIENLAKEAADRIKEIPVGIEFDLASALKLRKLDELQLTTGEIQTLGKKFKELTAGSTIHLGKSRKGKGAVYRRVNSNED